MKTTTDPHLLLAAWINGTPLPLDLSEPPTPTARELKAQKRREEPYKEPSIPSNAHQALFEALGGEPVVDYTGKHELLARALGVGR
jgi:hypothetical protein